ncbi:MAG: hypothetical protein K0B87_08350 [Candidatus Syntrophosphaera sp.]|nr:hypothetical protein [Candidatus Syntrophosphaera sp.]
MKKLLPAFIPIAWQFANHLKRNLNHNNDIRKFDKTGDKLETIENLIVRLEKKALGNREEVRKANARLQIWLAINSSLLIAIVIKLFFL